MARDRSWQRSARWRHGQTRIDFQTEPARYRHWKLAVDGEVATLIMDVDEKAALFEGYELKLNSYDLGVDIELADAIERLRFEHPQVRVVVLRSGKPRVFCAGANIRMLAGASHAHKVNFCKFTNETRNGIEDLQREFRARNRSAPSTAPRPAAATNWRWRPTTSCWSTTARPRCRCRNCRCSRCCRAPAGSPASPTSARCAATTPTCSAPPRKASKASARSNGGWSTKWCRARNSTRRSPRAPASLPRNRPRDGAAQGITLTPLTRTFAADAVEYGSLSVEFDRAARHRHHHAARAADAAARIGRRHGGARRRVLAARSSRANSTTPSCTSGSTSSTSRRSCSNRPAIRRQVLAYDEFLDANKDHWLAREIRHLVEARAQARRSHLALAGHADRAGLVLCRHACRTRLRSRPLLHADRHRARATTSRRRRSRSAMPISAPIRCRTD